MSFTKAQQAEIDALIAAAVAAAIKDSAKQSRPGTGALWVPKKADSKAVASGYLRLLSGEEVRICLFANKFYEEGGKLPIFNLKQFEDDKEEAA